MPRPIYAGLSCLIAAVFLLGACGQSAPIAVSVPTPTILDATVFPGAAALLFDGENIWVTEKGQPYRPGTVSKLRASDGEVLGSFPVGVTPNALAFDGEYIWVYNASDEALTKLRASSGQVVGTFEIGPESGFYGGIGDLLFDGEHIWVSYPQTRRLVQVRASDGKVLRTLRFDSSSTAVASAKDTMLKLDLAPRALAFDGEHVWVASSLERGDTLAKIRASDGEVIRIIPFDGRPAALAFDGEHIWVANASNDTVAKINPGDESLVESYSPGGPDVWFAAGNIWVASPDASYIRIIKYDPAGTVSDAYRIRHASNTFVLGDVLRDFAFDGESLWMVPADTGDVIKAAIPLPQQDP